MRKARIFLTMVFITVVISLLSGCVARVPIPEIQEGRFNFSVTYEIDGEESTYTGVYVCEYDGVHITCLGGDVNWKGYIENAGDVDVPIQTNEEGIIYLNFGFFPEYFMGDPDAENYQAPSPSLFMVYHSADPNGMTSTNESAVLERHGVKIISYEYADPIENTFKEKLSFGSFEPTIN